MKLQQKLKGAIKSITPKKEAVRCGECRSLIDIDATHKFVTVDGTIYRGEYAVAGSHRNQDDPKQVHCFCNDCFFKKVFLGCQINIQANIEE